MKTIVVDDERWMIKRFEIECKDIPDLQLIGSFRNPIAALEFVKENKTELAFLDVEMPEMTGLELAVKLREVQPGIIVIFVSAYEKYMAEAFKSQLADYYIMKPYSSKDIESAVDRARLLSGRLRKFITIKTFGVFDVVVDGEPISFPDDKTKELLAIFVDGRGGTIKASEAINKLWPQETVNEITLQRYNQLLKSLINCLTSVKLASLLTNNEQGVFLYTESVDCDLYSFLDGDLKAMRQFTNSYMIGYDWAKEEEDNLIKQNQILNQYKASLTKNSLYGNVHCKINEEMTITYFNEAFLSFCGFDQEDIAKEYNNSFRALINRDDFNRITEKSCNQDYIQVFFNAEFRVKNKKNRDVWLLCKNSPVNENEMECMLIDISDLKNEQSLLEEEAQRDGLTGLLNRVTAIKQIDEYLEKYPDKTSCLSIMDVDNFKQVNDNYGHPFADTVLSDIAAILKRSFRSDDVICRLGGDEMMIFLKDVSNQKLATEKFMKTMNNLRDRMKNKTKNGEISCSFGIAMYPDDGKDYQTLYRKADVALYEAKKEKNAIAVYSSDMDKSR